MLFCISDGAVTGDTLAPWLLRAESMQLPLQCPSSRHLRALRGPPLRSAWCAASPQADRASPSITFESVTHTNAPCPVGALDFTSTVLHSSSRASYNSGKQETSTSGLQCLCSALEASPGGEAAAMHTSAGGGCHQTLPRGCWACAAAWERSCDLVLVLQG